MQNDVDRCVMLARYVLEYHDTVRGAAQKFGISKSTVHKDLTKTLKQKHPSLYWQVRQVLLENKSVRHIRGGMATRKKYQILKEVAQK